jgi:methylenetetrahydrofolate reductase (NADPH)
MGPMRISDRYQKPKPVISFEFFPPKTDRGFTSLFRTIEELKTLDPDFVSVTMGAGGSTRSKTVDLVIRIQNEIEITAMAHLPCVGFERSQVGDIVSQLADAGVQNILALGGDPPVDDTSFVPPQDGFDYANELVGFIHEQNRDLCVVGACYPETHPSAPSPEIDLENLKRKVEAGAQLLITQLFFDNSKFFAFMDRVRSAGIDVPVAPGIMPIINLAGIRRMTSMSGCAMPGNLTALLGELGEDDDAGVQELGVRWATEQCRELLDNEIPGIHFYCLNKSSAVRQIHHNLFPKD